MWEYMNVSVKDDQWDKSLILLNEAGAQGWEFTGLVEDTGYARLFLMKRRIDGPQPRS